VDRPWEFIGRKNREFDDAGALPVTQHLQNTLMSDFAQFMGCFSGAPWAHKRAGGETKKAGIDGYRVVSSRPRLLVKSAS
jgi:hypothetical protein